MPQSLASTEGVLRTLVTKHVARGRVELAVSLQLRQIPGVEVEFNEDFGRALEEALGKARERGLVTGALTPGDLLRLPQAITVREKQTESDEATMTRVAARVTAAVDRALALAEAGDLVVLFADDPPAVWKKVIYFGKDRPSMLGMTDPAAWEVDRA